jgi:hypothetical protein
MADPEIKAEDNGHAATATAPHPRCLACGAEPILIRVRSLPIGPTLALSTFFCGACGGTLNCQISPVLGRIVPATELPRSA